MYNPTIDELILIVKICAYISGETSVAPNDLDKEAAKVLAKKIVDQSNNWSTVQKQQLKLILDLAAML